MDTSFDKILYEKYRIHLDTVCEALGTIGYETKEENGDLSAIKIVNNYRLHFIITKLPNGEIDRYCGVNLHKDVGKGRFHRVVENDDEINNEINLFKSVLSKIIRRKRNNFKKRLRNWRNLIGRIDDTNESK